MNLVMYSFEDVQNRAGQRVSNTQIAAMSEWDWNNGGSTNSLLSFIEMASYGSLMRRYDSIIVEMKEMPNPRASFSNMEDLDDTFQAQLEYNEWYQEKRIERNVLKIALAL